MRLLHFSFIFNNKCFVITSNSCFNTSAKKPRDILEKLLAGYQKAGQPNAHSYLKSEVDVFKSTRISGISGGKIQKCHCQRQNKCLLSEILKISHINQEKAEKSAKNRSIKIHFISFERQVEVDFIHPRQQVFSCRDFWRCSRQKVLKL